MTTVWLLVLVLQRHDAMQLVGDAIMAGVLGDLGSGSNVDICVITKHDSQLIRPFDSTVSDQFSSHHHRSALSLTLTISSQQWRKTLTLSKSW